MALHVLAGATTKTVRNGLQFIPGPRLIIGLVGLRMEVIGQRNRQISRLRMGTSKGHQAMAQEQGRRDKDAQFPVTDKEAPFAVFGRILNGPPRRLGEIVRRNDPVRERVGIFCAARLAPRFDMRDVARFGQRIGVVLVVFVCLVLSFMNVRRSHCPPMV